MSVTGQFVKVPKDIATGQAPDGTDLMAADKGYPLPPNDGTWQRDPVTNLGLDGPQWVLEHWGDTQPQRVFQFTRVEDIAYDKRPGMQNVVYVVDSGRGATSAGGNAFTSSNGRVWKLVLDKSDPTKVTSFSILIEGDDAPVKAVDEIHQPDNIESTGEQPADPGGPGLEPAVPAARTSRLAELRPGGDDGADLAVRPRDRARSASSRRSTSRPTKGPTDVDAAPTRQPRRLGVERHRRRVQRLRARRVPRGRPGRDARDRRGGARHAHRTSVTAASSACCGSRARSA